jgi:hypothetical protein
MTTLEPASVALKLAFLAVLYLFLLWVVRSAWRDLRRSGDGPSAVPSPVVTGPTASDPDATGLHRADEAVVLGAGMDGEPRLLIDHAAGHPDGIAYSLEHGATLGRGDVEIRLEDPFASTRHARIERQGSVLVLEDLGSTNGTYLNEEPLDGPRPLHHGDRIRIGDSQLTYLAD